METARTRHGTGFMPNRDLQPFSQQMLGPTDIDWQVGPPVDLLGSFDERVDVVVSAPPLGVRPDPEVELRPGEEQAARRELAHLLLLRAVDHLSEIGMAIFLLPEAFHWREDGRATQQLLADNGFFVSTVISVVGGTGGETLVPLILVLVDRYERDDLFVRTPR